MDGVAAGLAFGAGALSVADPCALAMVPAYVALRAQTDADGEASTSLTTGVAGLLIGFVGIFTLVGLALSLLGWTLLGWLIGYPLGAPAPALPL